MRIAYLILAHKDPIFITRLVKNLIKDTENQCFIHADRNTYDFENHMIELNGVHWMNRRLPIYWGGFNIVLAELELLKTSVTIGFDRYIVIHGADYPLYGNEHINNFFEQNKDTEFINAVDETTGSKSEWYRYVSKNYLDNPNLLKRLKNKLNATYWRSHLPKIPASCTVKYDNKEHHIFRGWAHFAITHEAACYIVQFAKEHPEYNKFFKYVYAPDESYFHTIIYNSEFAERTPYGGPIPESMRSLKSLLNLTYFEYPSSVREFKHIEEYDYLMNTGYLYFRKASSESRELLDYIDSQDKKQK